jgi:hypothetical protein
MEEKKDKELTQIPKYQAKEKLNSNRCLDNNNEEKERH